MTEPVREVVWQTGVVNSSGRVTFGFVADAGSLDGFAHLFVNDRYGVEFKLGKIRDEESWQRGGFSLEYRQRTERSGYYLLSVPAGLIRPGSKATLAVYLSDGQLGTYFLIYGHTDSASFENSILSPKN